MTAENDTAPPPRAFRARFIVSQNEVLTNSLIETVGDRISRTHSIADYPHPERIEDLGEVAIIPGLVNAHSHSFQRIIRSATEFVRYERRLDSFWTWRERMYEAATSLEPEDVYDVARVAFLEMLRTGITSVGEFHYIHHRPDGSTYADPNELAMRVINAARDTGIRICLLRVAYQRAGFEQKPNPRQARFIDRDVDHYLRQLETLETACRREPTATVGMAPHSIRAVSSDWISALLNTSFGARMPIHIHVCEQRKEIEESMAEYGLPPILALQESGLLGDMTTLVHATHLTDEEHESIRNSGASVCACPTTERNLGDGFLPARQLIRDQVPICLGSDSHQQIDLWEDRRLVEYHERLRTERRNVLAQEAGQNHRKEWEQINTADILWTMGSSHGARALGLPSGNLAPGELADFVTVDLDHLSIAGTSKDNLISDLVFSASSSSVRDTFVGGRPVIVNRIHADADAILARYRQLRSRQ